MGEQLLRRKINGWMKFNRYCSQVTMTRRRQYAAYHSSQRNNVPTKKVTSAVLPLFYESASSASMMKHSMDIALSITDFLNNGQLTFLCCDQPLYAFCKQLQWTYPEKYGLDKIFLVLGGLHIEKQIEQRITQI